MPLLHMQMVGDWSYCPKFQVSPLTLGALSMLYQQGSMRHCCSITPLCCNSGQCLPVVRRTHHVLDSGAGHVKGLAKRVIACLDVRANDAGDLVVTKGDQYDVRETDGAGREVQDSAFQCLKPLTHCAITWPPKICAPGRLVIQSSGGIQVAASPDRCRRSKSALLCRCGIWGRQWSLPGATSQRAPMRSPSSTSPASETSPWETSPCSRCGFESCCLPHTAQCVLCVAHLPRSLLEGAEIVSAAGTWPSCPGP